MTPADGALIPEEPTTMPTATKPKKKTPAKKTVKTVKKAPVRVDTRTSALPPLEPEMMNDILLAIHDKAEEVDEVRVHLEALITESDNLVREAVDDGERYRDIAAAANRTVPWVQMSLRRVAGVPTHPAAPIPAARIRKTSTRTYATKPLRKTTRKAS